MPRTKTALAIKSSDRIGVFGQPGTGKTIFTKYLASLVPADHLKILDPLDQYGGFPNEARIVPDDLNPGQEFDALCASLYQQGNMTLFVEEAQLYLPESTLLGIHTAMLLNRGRNYGLGIVVCSQRIQDINKRFFDLAQTIIFFRCGMTSKRYIRNLVAHDAADAVYTLKDHEFIYYSLRDDAWNKATLKFPQGRVPGDDQPTPPSVRMQSVE
jgi:DNA helicase HerA-like ATPase